MAYLKDLKPTPPPVDPPITSTLVAILGDTDVAHTHSYISDELEEDFSTSVELLRDVVPFMQMMAILQREQGFMGDKTAEKFAEKLKELEEFTGQWD